MELLARVPYAAALFASLAGVLAIGVAVLASRLRSARAMLAAAEERQATRAVESRRERYGLLWFPTLTVRDRDKVVAAAAAGVPHCARCVKPLSHAFGADQEWTCAGCGDRRPASTVDIVVTDSVVAEAVHEFLARHAGYRAASGLPEFKGARAA